MAPIIRAAMGFLLFAVSAHGWIGIGSLWRRFLFGIYPLPSPDIAKGRIHAVAADPLARSFKVPNGILKYADFCGARATPMSFMVIPIQSHDVLPFS